MIYNYFAAQKKTTIVLLGLMLLLLLGFFDYWTGFEYAFALFYILPVLLVTWYVGRGTGIAFSMASALTWQLANSLAGEVYSSAYVPIWNTTFRLGFFLAIVWPLARSKYLLEREKRLAHTDFLTSAWNSRAFHERAEVELNKALSLRQPLSLVSFDLDNFKSVNDIYGHSTGDRVLVMFVQTVQDHTRDTDMLARIGGDEFVLLLPNMPQGDAQTTACRVQDSFTKIMVQEGVPVTVSAGLVAYVAQPTSVDDLLRVADTMMYQAKREGKNKLCAIAYTAASADQLISADLFQEIETYVSTA